MPQITTVRVVRSRKVQPEQFGSAGAEVELFGTVLAGEDPMVVARNMLIDSRVLVYENLGLSLSARLVDAVAERDTPTETATAEIVAEGDTTKPRRGRRPGSKNKPKEAAATAPAPAETAAAPASDADDIPGDEAPAAAAPAETAAAPASDADDIPGDEPNIRANPENRVDPAASGDDIPGDDAPAPATEAAPAPEEEMTAEVLFKYINDSITTNKLTVIQAKKMQSDMKVVRVRDLNTPEKIAEAKAMIDGFIAENAAS